VSRAEGFPAAAKTSPISRLVVGCRAPRYSTTDEAAGSEVGLAAQWHDTGGDTIGMSGLLPRTFEKFLTERLRERAGCHGTVTIRYGSAVDGLHGGAAVPNIQYFVARACNERQKLACPMQACAARARGSIGSWKQAL
jgi:hypothetical protein